MVQYIDKAAVEAEINNWIKDARCRYTLSKVQFSLSDRIESLENLLSFLNTLEVKDPYGQCVKYDSIKAGIQAHAETYSFNIESELFNQLTKEQQKLWRKEIEQACVSGGEVGVELARDPRYKENIEVKEVDLEKEIQDHIKECLDVKFPTTNIELIKKDVEYTARKFFEIGIKAQKGE